MSTPLDAYVRRRIQELGLNMSELGRRARLSRQTLHDLGQRPDKLPSLNTVVALADVLQVHPMRLLQLLFEATPLRASVARDAAKGDRSAFVRDVNYPDGELVLPGQHFVKTWELQNVGSQVWENRRLVCQDEDIVVFSQTGERLHLGANLIPDQPDLPIPRTLPGDKVQVSMGFTAPQSPATVLSYWKSFDAEGCVCFPDARGVWVKVRINALAHSAHSAG